MTVLDFLPYYDEAYTSIRANINYYQVKTKKDTLCHGVTHI